MVSRGKASIALALLVLGACALRGHPAQLDVNSAPREALARLPGLSADDADRIVANRPYLVKEDLRERHVLDAAQYDAVADRLAVGQPGIADYLRAVPPSTP